jgi:hypothetical protein
MPLDNSTIESHLSHRNKESLSKPEEIIVPAKTEIQERCLLSSMPELVMHSIVTEVSFCQTTQSGLILTIVAPFDQSKVTRSLQSMLQTVQ